jgi:hypothetical protein
VEAWVPKAGVGGKTFDLRVVGVCGEPRFWVVRTSRTPITNLHLLNGRGEVEAVRGRMGVAGWEGLVETCRKVCGLFPKRLWVAMDVVVRSDWRAHKVVELNAFGDLLPGVMDGGEDVYGAQLSACAGAAA